MLLMFISFYFNQIQLQILKYQIIYPILFYFSIKYINCKFIKIRFVETFTLNLFYFCIIIFFTESLMLDISFLIILRAANPVILGISILILLVLALYSVFLKVHHYQWHELLLIFFLCFNSVHLLKTVILQIVIVMIKLVRSDNFMWVAFMNFKLLLYFLWFLGSLVLTSFYIDF